jgi:hypothetical protein
MNAIEIRDNTPAAGCPCGADCPCGAGCGCGTTD